MKRLGKKKKEINSRPPLLYSVTIHLARISKTLESGRAGDYCISVGPQFKHKLSGTWAQIHAGLLPAY